MKKALITAIDSFTGKYISKELERAGYEVSGTIFNAESVQSGVYALDLLDASQVVAVLAEAEPDVVIHLAGVSFVVQADISKLYATHIMGTRNLLEALSSASNNISKILLASSAQVYGQSVESLTEKLTETTPVCPRNDYAVSKVAMENMAALWADKLPITIVRPFNYTGVGQNNQFIIPKIVNAFKDKAEEIELGNTNLYRDFSDVRFVAECYKKLIASGSDGEIYNICSSRTISLSKILGLMSEITGHKINIKVNPSFIRANDPKSLIGSNEKLQSLIGNLNPIDIKDTLEWMYKENINESRH